MTSQPSTVNNSDVSENEKISATDVWKQILKIDWSNSIISFYVGYRKFQNKTPYSILSILKGDKQDKLFRKFLQRKLDVKHEFSAYTFTPPSSHSAVLTTPAAEYPYYQNLYSALNSEKMDSVKKYEMVIKGHFYVLCYTPKDGGEPLYAFRRMEKKYNVLNNERLTKFLWNENGFFDIENKPSFKLDGFFDYIVYNNMIFIFNQKNFEYILNVKDAIVNLSKRIINNLGEIGIIENPKDFESIVGCNMHHLRRVANIESEGYYKDEKYVKNMLKIIKEKKQWNIQLNEDATKIVVTPENMVSVVKVLTNNRLFSLISEEEFDIDGKQLLS